MSKSFQKRVDVIVCWWSKWMLLRSWWRKRRGVELVIRRMQQGWAIPTRELIVLVALELVRPSCLHSCLWLEWGAPNWKWKE